MRRNRSSVFVRGLAALVSITTVLQPSPAFSSPAEIMSSPAPAIESDAPKARDIKDGDATVATSTGALNYSYPIQVPPGRNGMQPQLALSYSSQAPIYGGIAAGWSLTIPQILTDTSQGRLRTQAPEVEVTQSDASADDRFISTLAGGHRLVRVTEPAPSGAYATYRADGDPSFARYVRMVGSSGHRWRVYLTDGTTMYFGGITQTLGCEVHDGFAPLTQVIDAFGNEVQYEYESAIAGECRIKRISWGQNVGASLSSFAEVVFGYVAATLCAGVQVGSQRSYASGHLVVTGASKLASITANAFPPGAQGTPVHTRLISLGYVPAVGPNPENCSLAYATPHRVLTSIQESAWGTDSPRVDLPAVTFTYGNASIYPETETHTTVPWIDPSGEAHRYSLAWGNRRRDDRWPTVEAMMLDVDGDGLLDRVFNASIPTGDGFCKASWQRNKGPALNGSSSAPQFDNATLLQTPSGGEYHLPALRWRGNVTPSPDTFPPAYGNEGCALNGQYTLFVNSLPATTCHDWHNPSCHHGSNYPLDPNSYCGSAGTQCPFGENGSNGTFLAYRWLDMDGDGLVDLVAAVHGSFNSYDIEQGNAIPFAFNPDLRPEPTLFGAWPACPAQADRCADITSSCEAAARVCPQNQLCTFNWAALNTCMATAPRTGCQNLVGSSGPRTPYTRCEGLYPWFIYKNQGRGRFATTPVIKYQPVPLESDAGDSNITGPSIAAGNHGIMDVDGDGVPDAVVGPREFTGNSPILWSVWLGDGNGGFGLKRYEFPTHDAPFNHISAIGGTPTVLNKQSEGLIDLNGDGLPDHWLVDSVDNVNIAYNDGVQLRLKAPPTSGPPIGEVTTPLLSKPGNDASITATAWEGNFVFAGDQRATHRVLDFDSDGRPDVVDLPSLDVSFNLGGQFNVPAFEYVTEGMYRDVKVKWEGNPIGPFYWELVSDVVDLDGDGLAESVTFSPGAPGNLDRLERGPYPPPRLLTTIDNGRGAVTTVSYASMHDSSGTVTQHPATVVNENGDFRPKASPQNVWVVKGVSTADSVAATTSTTSYKYFDPRHGKDDEGHYAFRGFEEVRTTAPSGAQTIERFAYSPDWSGRLVASLVVPAEATSEVRSLSRTTWEQRDLFGGTVRNFFPTVVEHFTCANGQGETQCTTSGAAPGYTRTTATLSALKSTILPGGPDLLWQETQSLLQAGTTAADGDRRTTSSFVLDSDASTYRLREVAVSKEAQVGGVFVLFAKSATTWDSSFRVPLTDEVWFDTDDAKRAIARSEYDMATGLVTRHYKPKQNAANTTFTQLTYDARKLFVAVEVNEVGHEFDYTWEYGTGTKLQTDGPNVRTCTQSCPNDATYPVKEQHKIRVDGLGREIERWDTVSDDGNIYTLYQMSTTGYVDAVVGTPPVPTSVMHQTRIDVTGPWKQEKTELDGHGRPKRQILYVQGTAPADQITTFTYRNDGTLASVAVPDPTQNNASTVSYTYTFDSLGRATSIRRPDAALDADKSGVDIAYDGTTKTVSEFVKPGDGQPAVTRTITDKLGRLVQVRERVQPTSLDLDSTWAITNYSYGPDDVVATVTDPQNVVTTLIHDFAGHRTEILRPNNRTWKYGYDKNGNVVSEQVPGSPDPTQDAKYTTTIAYDDLDRVASKVIGQRDLSDADQQLFGDYTETYLWDIGGNHKGYLRRWTSFAPGAGQIGTLGQYFSNNNQGQPTVISMTMNFAGYSQLGRTIEHTYFLFGGVRSTAYDEMVGGSNSTGAWFYYDARGLPSRVNLHGTGITSQDLGVQTRNVAGLVTKRRTDVTTTMGYVESNWTYDKLGRVASQIVQKGPGTSQVVRQDLAYFGNDDPKTLDHYLGTNQRHFQYGYDLRHQLTSATETTTPGYFSATYNYGLAGRFTHALEAQTSPAPPGSDLKPRDVNYQYSGTDPEQVTALTNVSGGQPFASYTYDAAGNQKTRCYGAVTTPSCAGELTEYVYDGRDQLRRATKKLNGVVQGSEEYWYDANGQRVSVVKRDAAGNKTEMIAFLGDAESHYDATGSLVHAYSHLSLGTPIARVDRTGPSATTVEYQFHGPTNNTLAAVSDSGTVNARIAYTPFGLAVEADGSDSPSLDSHTRRANDEYSDHISGLMYYGTRYLDQLLGEWTQSDPLYRFSPEAGNLQPRRANLYSAALNNPLRYVDPDGEDACTVAYAAGFFGGVACRLLRGDNAKDASVGTLKDAAGITQAQYTVGVIERHDPKEIAFDLAVAAVAGKAVCLLESVVGVEAAAEGLSTAEAALDTEEALSTESTANSKSIKQGNKDSAKTASTRTSSQANDAGEVEAAGHRKNRREGNREKHERGDERRKRDKGGEKGDERRRPPRQKPPGWRGPWPPPAGTSATGKGVQPNSECGIECIRSF